MIETNKLSVADVDKLKHVYGTNNNIVSVSIAEIEQTKKRLEVFILIAKCSGLLLNEFV